MSKYYESNNLKLALVTGANLTPFQNDTYGNFLKVDKAVGTNTVEYGQLDARMEAAEDDIMMIRDTTNANVAKITAMQSAITKNTGDIETLKPEGIDALQDRIEAVAALANTNANLIEALTTRLADDEDNLAQHAVRIGNLEAVIPLIQAGMKEIQAAINQLAAELNEAKAEIVNNQNDLAGLDETVSDHTTVISGINTQLTTIGTQITNVAANVANLQERQTDTEAKVIDLDGRVKALEVNV